MGTAENQGVDAALFETTKIGFDSHLYHGVVGPTLFDKWNEKWAGPAIDFDFRICFFECPSVGAALDRRFSANNPDSLVLRASDRAPHTRLDDTDHRHGKFFMQPVKRDCRRSVTSNDDDLNPLVDQKLTILEGITQHRLHRLGAVRRPRGITQVNGIFLWQGFDDFV